MSSAVLPGVWGHPTPLQLLLLLLLLLVLLLLLLLCCCYLANVKVCQVKEQCLRRFCLACWDTPPPFAAVVAVSAVASALLLLF